jgi:dTDP-4-dehydrorhamnose reductase
MSVSASKRVLVTGASGFVGAHIACGLASAGFDLVAIGGQRAVPEEVAATGAKLSKADLSDPSQVSAIFQAERPEVVVHLAALANAGVCEKDPALAERCNVAAVKNIVAAANMLASPATVIQFSTDLVFDGNSQAPKVGFTEEEAPEPCSIYGKTKRTGEQFILEETANGVVLRVSLVYGRAIGGQEGFLGWIRSGLSLKRSVTLFIDEWRTPILVDDITRTVIALVSRSTANPDSGRLLPRLLHLGGPERINRFDFGVAYARRFGFDENLLIAASQLDFPAVPPRPSDVSLSSARLVGTVGIEPLGVVRGLDALT